METSWLELPVQIQIAIASGYAAHMAANTGIRGHHSAIDTTFGAAAYGLVATSVLTLLPRNTNLTLGAILAFALTVFAGLFWRKIGNRLWLRLLAFLDVTRADDSPSAWLSLQNDTKTYLTQIAVQLEDNSWLRCDDAAQFRTAPFGPCIMGPNGDIALYLTHEKDAEGNVREVKSVRHGTHGDRLTYVPAARIKRIHLRQLPKD